MPVDRSKLPNAFQFVTMAGARARQLLDGFTPRVEPGVNKPARAEREVLSGAVTAVDEAAAPDAAPAGPVAQKA